MRAKCAPILTPRKRFEGSLKAVQGVVSFSDQLKIVHAIKQNIDKYITACMGLNLFEFEVCNRYASAYISSHSISLCNVETACTHKPPCPCQPLFLRQITCLKYHTLSRITVLLIQLNNCEINKIVLFKKKKYSLDIGWVLFYFLGM